MTSFRRFSGGGEPCCIQTKSAQVEPRFTYSPEINRRIPDDFFCTQFNKSTSSSTCNSEDSGIARTLNLSPHSPVIGDSDSEDSVSLDGLHVPSYTQQPRHYGNIKPAKFYPHHYSPNVMGKYNVAEAAQYSPQCGMCVAATHDEPGVYGEKQNDNRFHIMSFEQVKRLHSLLSESVPIHSRQPGCPTIWVRLSDLFQAVEENLKVSGIPVRDIRLNGGAASYILGCDSAPSYNDIDVLISVDLSSQSSTIQRVKSSVLDALMRFLPEDGQTSYPSSVLGDRSHSSSVWRPRNSPIDPPETSEPESRFKQFLLPDTCSVRSPSRSPTPHPDVDEENSEKLGYSGDQSLSYAFSPSQLSTSTTSTTTSSSTGGDVYLRESYIYKQFRKYSTHDSDCWSLLSLGMPSSDSKVIELKFVDRMRRQFEFTVDSFQICLPPMLSFMQMYPTKRPTPNFSPTVVAESVAGSFSVALYHLQRKLILTKEPEMIRGGGLLKYCRLLVSGYQAPDGVDVGSLERYMSSRFFIDFQDIPSQKAKLEAFLTNHFKENENEERISFLRTVHRVVSGSSICLMSFERFQTLNLISQLIEQYTNPTLPPKVTISLDWFASQQNLTVDTIFYGTQYFPIISCNNSVRYMCCQWDKQEIIADCEKKQTSCSIDPSNFSSDAEFQPECLSETAAVPSADDYLMESSIVDLSNTEADLG